jgi:uncharacterized OB-fold protein
MVVQSVKCYAQSPEFFDASADGRLLIKQCTKCDHYGTPATESCRHCGATALQWVDSAGRGKVVAAGVVNGRPLTDAGPGRTAVGIVELGEGLWMYAQFVGPSPDDFRIGDVVEVEFQRPDGSEALPAFKLSQ